MKSARDDGNGLRRLRRFLGCVVNISEGRRPEVVAAIAASAGVTLLDIHVDPDHHRAVLTLGGPAQAVEAAARAVAVETVSRLDVRGHAGAHPRIGVLDVVPFAPLRLGADLSAAAGARDRFVAWAGRSLDLPCFSYGPGAGRSLPEVRRGAFVSLVPDSGPRRPHPTAGACAVGARGLLVAWNAWMVDADVVAARRVASALRNPSVRALGLELGGRAQVSCNLIEPERLGPGAALAAIERLVPVERCELVGLAPEAVLATEPEECWARLDLSRDRTIEARLEQAGLDGGRFG